MAVTQRDIAEEVGVSVRTVSMVLSDKEAPLIGDATRRRVREVAEELGYRPNPYARVLAGGKAPLIKFSFRPTSDYISNLKASRLVNALRGLDRDVIIADDVSFEDPQTAIEKLSWGSPEAVVFGHLENTPDDIIALVEGLNQKGIYTLIASVLEELDPQAPCDSVRLDRTGGARKAMKHLLELGHTHIALITADLYRGRAEGYHTALEDAGIPDRYVVKLDTAPPTSLDPQKYIAREAAARTVPLLSQQPRITAMLCPSDMAAFGVMNALRDMELTIPDDISLIGFHDDPWTEFLDVPLTTLAEPVEQTRELCREMIKARLEGDAGPWRHEVTEYELVVRSSTGPAPR